MIKEPMDFSTMKIKLHADKYSSLDAFKYVSNTKVITSKTQAHAVSARRKRVCKRSLSR